MRVVFLETDTERSWAVASIGPAFLGAFLRANGHEAGFVRAAVDMSDEDVVRRVIAEAPDLIGVSLTTRQWLRARHLIGLIRQQCNAPVIAGGLHATFSPEVVLSSPGFDYVCLGEGEEALLDLVNAIERGTADFPIANIWRRGGVL